MSTLAEQVVEQLKTDMDNVYDAGYQKGKSEGGDSYYDEFWDSYQDYGNRTDYRCAFYGVGWTEEAFKPKYKIVPSGNLASNMCNYSKFKKITEENFDFSKATLIESLTNYSNIEEAIIDVSSCTQLRTTFQASYSLRKVTIRNLLRTCLLYNTFAHSDEITDIFFIDGVIGSNINLQWSPLLSNESVQNIIDCLADLTGQATQTLTFHADVKAKLTEEQIATITSKNWTLA